MSDEMKKVQRKHSEKSAPYTELDRFKMEGE
jgi:hypothetical protein